MKGVSVVSGPPGSHDRFVDKGNEIARSFLLPFLSRDHCLEYIFSSHISFAADPVEINVIVRYVVLYFYWFLFQQNRSLRQVKVNKAPYPARYSLLRFVRKKSSRLLSYVLWVIHATRMTHINHSRVLTTARLQASDSTSSDNTSRKVGFLNESNLLWIAKNGYEKFRNRVAFYHMIHLIDLLSEDKKYLLIKLVRDHVNQGKDHLVSLFHRVLFNKIMRAAVEELVLGPEPEGQKKIINELFRLAQEETSVNSDHQNKFINQSKTRAKTKINENAIGR